MSLIMKDVSRKILMFMALLSAVSTVQATKVYVCDDPDQQAILPGVPGSREDGVTRFANKNVKYPLEAWRSQKWFGVEAMGLVDANGHVIDFELMADEEPHPLLMTELRRAIEKMEWYPALKDGVPVASWQYFYMPLTKKSSRSDYWVPLGMEERFDLTNLYAFKWEEPEWDHGTAEMRKALDCLGESTYLFPGYAPATIAYARLLAAQGRGAQALSQIEVFLPGYQANGYNVEVTEEGDTLQTGMSPEYSGRTEVWTATVRALLHDMMQSPGCASAYDDAIALTEQRMIDGLLFPECTSKNDTWLSARMHNLKYIKDREHREVAAAAVRQEKADKRAGKSAETKDQQNLFGVKAMLLWLRDGDAGLDLWIGQIRAGKPSGKLLKYLSKLEKRKRENEQLLSDRRAVIVSLVCLVPPEGTDEAAANDFYARRKAVADVFPLQWLTE